MAYYSNHNLAYDFRLFEEEEVVRPYARKAKGDGSVTETAQKQNNDAADASPKKEAKKGRTVREKRRRNRFGRIAIGILAGLAIVLVVVSIIHGQVQLTELNQEIINARAELSEKQSIYTQLEMKVDSSISTSAVEQYAKENLSMNKAANSQKEFISLSEGDKAEVTLEEDKNIFERIAEAIASLWS
jgi:cell division protein FtsL